MRVNKYKIFTLILLTVCSLTAFLYSNINTKIDEALLKQETVEANSYHKQRFTVYDALACINKNKGLEVVKINIDEKNSCSIEIIYNGTKDNFLEILDNLSKEIEVSNIGDISLNSNGSLTFSVNFMLNK